MKEGINLATSYIKQNPREFILEKKDKPLLPLIILTAATSLLGLGLLISLGIFEHQELSRQKNLQQKLASLAGPEKEVNLIFSVQSNLNRLQSHRESLTKIVDLTLNEIPADTKLTNLSVSAGSLNLSAQTPSGASFARLIAGLLKSGGFKEILLTGSRFDQKSGFFSFNLICQTT